MATLTGPAPLPDRALRPATRWTLIALVAVSNIVGAAVVLVLAAWVLPTSTLVADEAVVRSRNVVAFGVYVVVAVVVGIVAGLLRMRIPPPPPEDDEDAVTRHRRRVRQVVLDGPVRLTAVQVVPWALATALFAALNAPASPRLAVVVAVTVALGGATTVAVSHRLSEISLRAEVARVMAVDPPSGPAMPGVLIRSVGAWLLGTGLPLAGVCLAMLAALLFGGPFSQARLAGVGLVLTGVALTVGLLVTTLTATSVASPVVSVRRAMRRVEQGQLEITLRVSDTTELGLLQAGFNRMVAGLRERERLRDLFGRHVGTEVARAAEDADLHTASEVEVAVLFVDVVDSTSLAATRDPAEVMAELNRFFGVVVEVVGEHGGWINKFEGDAALAVFGAPAPHDDAAGGALAAARHLAERLHDELGTTRAGVGVSAGTAVAGTIGNRQRYEYTVVGDPVNEAARLCELAKSRPGLTLAAGAAVDRAGADEAACWTGVGSALLRGRSAETELAEPAGAGERAA